MGLISLDACVLIDAVERSPLYGERVLQALDHEAASGPAGTTKTPRRRCGR